MRLILKYEKKISSLKKKIPQNVIFILIYCCCYDNDVAYKGNKIKENGFGEYILFIRLLFFFIHSSVCVAPLIIYERPFNPYNSQSIAKNIRVYIFFFFAG